MKKLILLVLVVFSFSSAAELKLVPVELSDEELAELGLTRGEAKPEPDEIDVQVYIDIMIRRADEGNVEFQKMLGRSYRSGEYFEVNEEKSFHYYMMAAEQNDAEAQAQVGVMYDYGVGVEEDDLQSLIWISKAVDQGHAGAQLMKGLYFLNGHSFLEKDPIKAFSLIEQSAKQGNSFAHEQLARMYFLGEGVIPDYVQGYAWISLAAAQGSEKSKELLNALMEDLNEEQIAAGRELAKKYWDMYVQPEE